MTNTEKWNFLTQDLEAPQVFLDAAWWFTISAALERRVFFGDIARPLFCNNYIFVVGPPGIGKGTSQREASQLIGKHELLLPDGTHVLDKERRPRGLFHKLPDTTTFEALVWDMASCTKGILKPDGAVYSHASAYFMLEELSSLFRKNKSEDVSRLLLNLYDCVEYEYRTKTKDTARIRNGCLNLLAGTTIDFIRTAESAGLLGEGLFSRALIVFADQPRKIQFNYSNLTPEQKQAQKELQEYVKSLSTLYGQIIVPPEVIEWQESWWEKEYARIRGYEDEKLLNFFSRRKLQVYKLTAALHYAESRDMEIPLATWIRAADVCKVYEQNVIRIARRTGKNQTYSVQEQCIRFIAQQPRTHAEVVNFLAPQLEFMAIMNLLETLKAGNKIKEENALWKVA